MQSFLDQHLGWKILILPTAKEWQFRCFSPEDNEPLTNDKTYGTLPEAIAGAKLFIEKRSARNQLSDLLGNLLEAKRIAPEEYRTVLELITRLAAD
jgi:hypothetical protein